MNSNHKDAGKLLVVQIPAFNECQTLPNVLKQIPRSLPGIGRVIIQVIDDGSTDGTPEIAIASGADFVIKHVSNRGLSRSFMSGMINALRLGADIIVNTDADNQYPGVEIGRLVAPILAGKADIVIGNRLPGENKHFPFYKRVLQVIGSKFVSWISGAHIPDAASGFRAYSRFAALRMQVYNEFSYALETIIQSNRERLTVLYVPITTNPASRPSRLHKGIIHFLFKQGGTIIRSIILYRPIRSALLLGTPVLTAALFLLFRYLYFYFIGETGAARHIQSVFVGGTLFLFGLLVIAVGFLGEGLRTNQRMMQEVLIHLRDIEHDDHEATYDGLEIIHQMDE